MITSGKSCTEIGMCIPELTYMKSVCRRALYVLFTVFPVIGVEVLTISSVHIMALAKQVVLASKTIFSARPTAFVWIVRENLRAAAAMLRV
jgi:hypothetical protein